MGNLIFCSVLFFLCFFRVSFFSSILYISFVLGFLGFIKINFGNKNSERLSKVYFSKNTVIIILFLFVFSLVVDVTTGTIFKSINATFSFRILSMIFGSILPAFFIVSVFLKGSYNRLLNVVSLSFFIQSLFWLLSYFDLNFKIFLYSIMGASDATNLNELNLAVRGFGMSREINYTSPFLMVFISLMYLNRIHSFYVIPMQVINSNLTLVAILFGSLFSKVKLYLKIILGGFLIFIGVYIGKDYLPRLYDEFQGGESRTINILIENSVHFLNSNALEWLMGTSRYLFHSIDPIQSDIGWVILLNFGGVVYTVLVIAFMLNVAMKLVVFEGRFKAWIWFSVALVLNTKGLIFGMNGLFFFLAILIFNYNYASFESDDYNIVGKG